MGKGKNKSNPHTFRHGTEFIRHAEKCGCEVRRCKGSHCLVYVPPHGGMTIPEKELSPGIRGKILKWFVAVGLAIMFLLSVGVI
jgi:predicted RNA binding protein YcfA (HicA-like mRNA interferase family)